MEHEALYCPNCGAERGCSEKTCDCGYPGPLHTHNPDHMMFHPDCPACEAERAADSAEEKHL